MPHAKNDRDDTTIRYEVDGDGPAVIFCGDVGLGVWQFSWQHAAVAGPYTAITPEPRGVGESGSDTLGASGGADGRYTVQELADDLDAVLAAETVRNAHVVGYGLGGMVALAYALSSSRPASLTLIGTPATGDAYNPEAVWADPNDRTAIDASLNGLLSTDFREQRPDALVEIAEWRVAEDVSPRAFEAQRAAIEAFDVGDRLYEITIPTLVIHGSDDHVCPVTAGESLAAGLPRGEFTEVGDAGHLVGVEASRLVNDELLGWLEEHADRER